jgi:hypothetical protein|nr:hypothetical protein [Phenylobacterium sp.]
MGRREITIYAAIAVFGLGGTALVSGLVATHTAATPFLVWGGTIAMALSGVLLLRMMLNAPALVVASGAPSAPSREFLGPEVTPLILKEKVEGRTRVQIIAITAHYRGKWMTAEGVVGDVSRVDSNQWLTHVRHPDGSYGFAACFGKKWHQQLLSLNKGDWISMVGRVDNLDTGALLEDCEIVDMGPPPKPKRPSAPRKPRARKAKAA